VRGVWTEVYGLPPEVPPAYSSLWTDASAEETLIDAAGRHMTERAIADREAGDVLIFRWRPHLPAKHCGILVAPGRLIHAYEAAGKVAEVSLVSAWVARLAAVYAFPGSD
jgi:NlpC/P60 family putative phage cell wall peptidase